MPRTAGTKPKTVNPASRNSMQDAFYSDLSVKDMLYGAIIRSPIRRGMITAVSHPDLPDNYSIITARDVPGSNLVTLPLGKIPLFSEGNVSYLGEPLGILVGPDENTVHSLLKEVQVSFDTKTIEDYLEESQEPDEDFFSRTLAERTVEHGPCFVNRKNAKAPGIQSVFEGAAHVAEHSWTFNLNAPDYREPVGAICVCKADSVTVYAATQWPGNLRRILAEVLHRRSEDITIKKTRSYNCSSSSVWYTSLIAGQVAVASYKTGHAVKLVYGRQEQQHMEMMQPITIVHKTAADEDGHLLAMHVHIDFDAGFANPFAQEIIDRLVIASCGSYAAKNVRIAATAYRSANPASSIDLRLIDSAAFFAVENQMTLLGKAANLTPLEIRLINFSAPEKKSQAMPFLFELTQRQSVLESLAQLSDFNRKHAAYQLSLLRRTERFEDLLHISTQTTPLRGIGLSCAFEGTCYFGSQLFNESEQSIEVSLLTENTISIHCPPISASIQAVWTKLAAGTLGIPQSGVKINTRLDADNEPPLPERIYSNISVMTELLKKCCEAVKRKRQDAKLPFTVRKALSTAQKKAWNNVRFTGKPFYAMSFAAACVELDVDPCTFRETIRHLEIIIDGGKILNLPAAENAAKLAALRVLRSLVSDDRVECRNLRISFLASEDTPAQIGELIYHVLPAAYTQALSQATGCRMDTLPLHTDSIYKKLMEKQAELHVLQDAEIAQLKEQLRGTEPEGEEQQ